MPLIFRFISRRRLKAALAAIVVAAVGAWACGPEFPNRYLEAPDATLLAAPEAIFAEEVARIAGAVPVLQAPAMPTTRSEIIAADVEELRESLRRTGQTQATIDHLGEAYAGARAALDLDDSASMQGNDFRALPSEIPAEFRGYIEGAAAWRAKQRTVARSRWLEILDLPEDERHFRTTWAAFMIGRTWEQEVVETVTGDRTVAAEQARRWFRRARADAAKGFADSLGLAAASFGREARVELRTGHHRAAINLYVAQLAAGDTTAVNSLRDSASDAISADRGDFSDLARDPVARGVITAYFLARARGNERPGTAAIANLPLEKWALALHAAGASETAQADRLAWLAYHAGQYALAGQWLDLASPEAPVADWIRAKLALRAGDLPRAEGLLSRAAEAGRLDPRQRKLALAELGRTRLALDDRTGALTAWLDAAHWEDAAYLGEQILTLDELRSYVETRCTDENTAGGGSDWRDNDPAKVRGYLRTLLARRLVREGDADTAAAFFPEVTRSLLAEYITASREGFDVSRPAEERAAAFWRAAKIMREHGLDLWATELEPDWAISGANFDRGAAGRDRLRIADRFGPTVAERERLEKHAAATTRFSYRYRAAELAWWAASLLPNDSDETARILIEAGGWLKARDPNAAERFYQALVIRCGNTALGRAAAEKNWFPLGVENEPSAANAVGP